MTCATLALRRSNAPRNVSAGMWRHACLPRYSASHADSRCCWHVSSVLEPPGCRALVTVQRACLDCDDRYKVDGDCHTRFSLPGFASATRPDAAQSLAEQQQNMTFVLVQVTGNPSTFSQAPAIDLVTGTLSFCLEPTYTGVNIFDVSLLDDGYMVGAFAESSTPQTFGPFKLTILVSSTVQSTRLLDAVVATAHSCDHTDVILCNRSRSSFSTSLGECRLRC